MNISDSELMMIEQLTYLGFDAGDKGKNIRELLSEYTEEKIASMIACGGENADNAAVIRYIKSNDKLCDLVLSSTMQDADNKTLALCFQDTQNSSNAIVAFKGTTSKEWGDNIEGLNETDTQRQLEALEYIEALEEYNDIIVVGHSKGGNKAMYVAINSDKVLRCVAMDSQGFSHEFFEKYNVEIGLNAYKIRNYSIKSDYVHVLLFQLPGSEQIYCEGYRIGKDIGRHHQPFTFFSIDENGEIVLDTDETPLIVSEIGNQSIKEDPSVIMLHDFTTFILNVATDEDKKKIVNYLATLADMVSDMIWDKSCSVDELIDYITNDLEMFSLLWAYLVSYMDTYNLSSKDIDALLVMLGLNSLDEYFTLEICGIELCGISDLLDLTLKELTDGKKDYMINALLSILSNYIKDEYGIKVDIKRVWDVTERKINSIGKVLPAAGKKEPSVTVVSATILINTATMLHYAERLNAVNRKLVDLEQRIKTLYSKAGFCDLWSLLQANLMLGYSEKIRNCSRYLHETANDFNYVERNNYNLF